MKLQASSVSIQDLHNSTLADIYLRSHGKLIDNMASDSLQRNDSNVDTTINTVHKTKAAIPLIVEFKKLLLLKRR